MKKVIIYGGAGFIGSVLAQTLCKKKVQVCIVEKPGIREKREYNRIKNLPVELVECNLSNVKELPLLLKEDTYDVFYQLAWNGLDNESLKDYSIQLMNVEWIMNSIEIAAKLGCHKFIGAGSVTERELLVKNGRMFQADRHKYYRAMEFSCETLGRSVAFENGIEFFWPHIINVYGPGEKSPRLINSLIRNLLEGKEMPLSEGKQLYDFLYVSDAAEAFRCIGENGKDEVEYVIGSGNYMPLREYLKKTRDIIAPDMKLSLGKLTYDGLYMDESQFNISDLKELGFCPVVSFEEGILKTMEWIKKDLENKKYEY